VTRRVSGTEGIDVWIFLLCGGIWSFRVNQLHPDKFVNKFLDDVKYGLRGGRDDKVRVIGGDVCGLFSVFGKEELRHNQSPMTKAHNWAYNAVEEAWLADF
jgi:hypothetical protein